MGLVTDGSDIIGSPGEKVAYREINLSCVHVYFYSSVLSFIAILCAVSHDSEIQE